MGTDSMSRLAVFVVLSATLLAACARDGTMIPIDANDPPGVPRLDMTLYGTGYGPATITMPDGEILRGNYRLAVGGTSTTVVGAVADNNGNTVVGSGSGTSVSLQNPFTLQAVGDHGTSMVCRGSAGGLGHGDAVCHTNHGARYQMMF